MGASGVFFSGLAVCAMLAYVISMPVFYGIFAFGGHEDWNCYAS